MQYLMILEEEEGLHEGKQQMQAVYRDEDEATASIRVRRLEVGRDVKAIQGHAP